MKAGLIILRVASLGLWATTLKLKSTPGKMNAGLIILRVALDATRRMSATELVCAAPSQQRLRRSSIAAPSQQHYNLLSTQLVVVVASLLEVLGAA